MFGRSRKSGFQPFPKTYAKASSTPRTELDHPAGPNLGALRAQRSAGRAAPETVPALQEVWRIAVLLILQDPVTCLIELSKMQIMENSELDAALIGSTHPARSR